MGCAASTSANVIVPYSGKIVQGQNSALPGAKAPMHGEGGLLPLRCVRMCESHATQGAGRDLGYGRREPGDLQRQKALEYVVLDWDGVCAHRVGRGQSSLCATDQKRQISLLLTGVWEGQGADDVLLADAKQLEIPVIPLSDDARSANTTPLNTNTQDKGLGATDPPKGSPVDALRAASPPSPETNIIPLKSGVKSGAFDLPEESVRFPQLSSLPSSRVSPQLPQLCF